MPFFAIYSVELFFKPYYLILFDQCQTGPYSGKATPYLKVGMRAQNRRVSWIALPKGLNYANEFFGIKKRVAGRWKCGTDWFFLSLEMPSSLSKELVENSEVCVRTHILKLRSNSQLSQPDAHRSLVSNTIQCKDKGLYGSTCLPQRQVLSARAC